MDRPSTPDNNNGGAHGYQPLTGALPANAPPSYFEVPNESTPTGTPGNGSGMRLLTSVDSGMERPYVAPIPSRMEPPPPTSTSNTHSSAARTMQRQMLPRRKTLNVRIVDAPTVLGSCESDSGRTTKACGGGGSDSGSERREPSGDNTRDSILELPSLPPLTKKSSASSVSPTKKTRTKDLRERVACGGSVDGDVNAERLEEQMGAVPRSWKSSNLQNFYRSTPGRAQRSSTPSVLNNAPRMPPPGEAPSYPEYSPGRGSPVQWSPSRAGSTASRRPPSRMQYERADINGSPRPGTPSSQYGGSPRRPLPPAPLFSKVPPSVSEVNDEKHDSEETTIPISPSEDNDDPFVGGETRSQLRSRASYNSDETYEEDYEDEEYDEKMSHYGPAPKTRHARRGARQPQMSKKEVALINGELILECKIPTILQSFLPRKDGSEFTHMRYTAVTCEPDDFSLNGYKLRQQIMSPTRETELFICVTMYNESEIDFTRTMHGVMRNISHFCSRSKSRTWGKNGWQKIVVCIVSDGRAKVHPRTLDALAAMGVYQDGIAKNMVNQKEVKAHVYEYTTQVSMDSDLKFKGAEKGIVPCQMIFCLKEKNAKKLNSHRWFFNAFGKALQPNVCILLDVGTRPGPNALYHLWKAFDNDSNVAGACGEIIAGKGKHWLGLLNPLVASQNFEYKMSNILDKPIESVFGYITVLPGALSAYRYYALQNDSTGQGPLSQYFKGEALHGSNADVFTANMYLAEDRILCWELVAKRDERWVLKYVRRATGETDVPDTVPELISQRRRWLNGAFFAAVYSMVHCRQIWRTDHTIARKVLLHIEFVYQFIQLCFTWFSLANFYLTFYFIAGGLSDPRMDPFGHNIGLYIFVFLRYCCVLLICTQFILSMGNRPQGAKRMFLTSMVVYAIIMAYTTFATLYIVIKDFTGNSKGLMTDGLFINIVVSTASTVGLYFLMSFIYLDPWHMFTSAAQYFALLPSYICTLQIYAFCNTHDISWGTKGDNVTRTDLGAAVGSKEGAVTLEMPSEQLDIDSGYDEALRNLRDRIEVAVPGASESQMQEDYYRAVRTYMVLAWLISNAILAMAVSEAYDIANIGSNFYLTLILWSVAVLALFRAVGSTCYRIIGVVHSISNAKAKIKSGNLKAPDWISEGSSKVSSKFGGGSSGVSKIGSSSGTSRFSFFSGGSGGGGFSSKFSNLTSRD